MAMFFVLLPILVVAVALVVLLAPLMLPGAVLALLAAGVGALVLRHHRAHLVRH